MPYERIRCYTYTGTNVRIGRVFLKATDKLTEANRLAKLWTIKHMLANKTISFTGNQALMQCIDLSREQAHAAMLETLKSPELDSNWREQYNARYECATLVTTIEAPTDYAYQM